MTHHRTVLRRTVVVVATLLCGLALAACDPEVPGGTVTELPSSDAAPTPAATSGSASGPTPGPTSAGTARDEPATGDDLPGTDLAADEVVPDTPSGYSPYIAPQDAFSVDLPSGWGVSLSPAGALATPDGGSEGLVMVVDVEVDDPSVDAVLAQVDALPSAERRDADVPGAVEASRITGETFAPLEAVVAVDEQGNAAVVIAFDNGGSTPEQRDHVLGSLQFPAVEVDEG